MLLQGKHVQIVGQPNYDDISETLLDKKLEQNEDSQHPGRQHEQLLSGHLRYINR